MRPHVELLLRVVAVATLAILLWRQLPREGAGDAAAPPTALAIADLSSDTVGSRTVEALLQTLLHDVAHEGNGAGDRAPRASLSVPALPPPASRAALAAASGGGMAISWTDSTGAAGLAVGATSVPGTGELLISAAGAPGALVLRDDGGVLDSLPVGASTASLLVRRGASWLEAVQRGSSARVAVPAPVLRKRVMLYGRPGWETKFTVAALEEAGWQTDATLPVSPTASVTVGAPSSLDTGRYGAAVVIDSGLARPAVLSRFIGQGGGVILSGDALQDPGLAGIAPARAVGDRAAIPGGLLSPVPTSGLEAVRVTPVADALVLQREAGGAPSAVVMRRGAGRVLALVYRESWRWRMEGDDDAVDAHREHWAAGVRTVAYAPTVAADSLDDGVRPAHGNDNAAPYADLVARLGAASPPPARREAPTTIANGRRVDLLLLLAAFAALLAEWASRRLRGAR